MAFIVVADRTQEVDRRELLAPMVIGRSPECDLPIRDILLSRKHCMIERIGETWVAADLSSKNGTRVNGELITRHVLHDGDVIRIGRTRICFRGGLFIPAPKEKRPNVRPVDPIEALAGTLSGFSFDEESEEKLDQEVLAHFPRPKPHPVEPRAYRNEQVYTMLADIASSAWDSELTAPSRRVQVVELPTPMIAPPKAEEDSLQLKPSRDALPATEPESNSEKFIAWISITGATLLTMACVWVISRGW